MRGWLALAALVVAGCTSPPGLSPFVPELSEGRPPAPLPVAGVPSREVVAIGEGITIEADSAPALVSEVGAPFCDLVRHVLGDVGKVPHSCVGQGSFSFDSGADRPGAEVVAAFLRAVVALGGSVTPLPGGALLVTQGGTGGGAVFGAKDQPELPLPEGAEDQGNGLLVLPGDQSGEVFRSVAAAVEAVIDQRGAVSIFDGYTVEDVTGVAAVMGLPLRAYAAQGVVVASGPAHALAALQSVLEGGQTATLQADLGGLGQTSLEALSAAYRGVEFHRDALAGLVYVVGPPEAAMRAYGAMRRVQSESAMVGLDVQLLEFTSDRARELALDALSVGFDVGDDGLDLVRSSAGYTARLGVGDFELLARALASTGEARLLARPQLRFRNGAEARFQSGVDVPIPVERQREEGGDVIRTFEYRSTGVVLTASGSVLADGAVALSFAVEVSSAQQLGTAGAPRFSVRSARSDFVVADGETVLISGLRQVADDRTRSGPAEWLPLASSSSGSESELMVLVTARALDHFARSTGRLRPGG